MPDMINTFLRTHTTSQFQCLDGYEYVIRVGPDWACFPQRQYGPFEEVEVWDEQHGVRLAMNVFDLEREIVHEHGGTQSRATPPK